MAETGGMKTFFTAPVTDVLQGMERCLEVGVKGLFLLFGGLLIGWWIYVPLHELLHAFACIVTGGTVSRLEIDPLYGGGLLAQIFPFVEAGGDYAGRLSGFDTGGNDGIYLATDLGPFLLTVFPGVWALRWAARRRSALGFGFWLPFALAPFMSLTGDAYEIGSILVTWLPPWSGMEGSLRSDDIFRLFPELGKLASPPWGGAVLGVLVGILWAFATYALGARLSSWLVRRRVVLTKSPTTDLPTSGD